MITDVGNEPVTVLKGIGNKTAAQLEKLGLRTVGDLTANFPRSYESFERPTPVISLPDSGIVSICGVITSKPFRSSKNGRVTVSVWVDDGTAKIRVFWFNNPWIANSLRQGKRLVFRGHVTRRDHARFLTQPKVWDAEDYESISGTLLPVYSLTAGVTNALMRKATAAALDRAGKKAEYLPEEILAKYDLRDPESALRSMHFPADEADLISGRSRMVFEEFFLFLLALKRLRQTAADGGTAPVLDGTDADRLMAALPYELTGAQKRAWEEIRRDLASGKPMNRLLQGDVGSGKTVVAALALAQAASCGYQAAMIAPTLILAEQHYENLKEMFRAAGLDRKIVLLTGAVSRAERAEALAAIESGEAEIIVGTHALIQEGVRFAAPALVITDEQHRFGVKQRETFAAKGGQLTLHILVMSATPIPRTLAIILYGEQSVSVLDEKPQGRLPVKNAVVNEDYRERTWKFIAEQVAEGRQCYVICPMIEDNDITDAASAVTEYELLRKRFRGLSVGLLHGRMKNAEKEDVMRAFAAGETDILVSTTVIEVGVDVPNATVMLIENAECFGLAQLHQLRGRIGRGKEQSYCIFMDGSGREETNERLKVLLSTNDGFRIASEDLKLRGPGDLFGVRQSGDLAFRVADICLDARTLKAASDEAEFLFQTDPGLKETGHRALAERLDAYMRENGDRLLL
ncbi:MAG: ATP-dependent DNA helicase RecG [Lachnospiraceae bacterium]|nr:ATP-dependent DNA helicase RecG [Lachnospiraceae bacterium]